MNIPGRKFFPGDSIFTDWVSRGGDNVILRADRVSSATTVQDDCKVTITAFTKNTEDEGDGTSVKDSGGTNPLTFEVNSDDGTDIQELIVNSLGSGAQIKGLLELVRLKIVATGDPGNWIQVRLFPPIFFNAAS